MGSCRPAAAKQARALSSPAFNLLLIGKEIEKKRTE